MSNEPPEDDRELKINSLLVDYMKKYDSGEVVDRVAFLKKNPEMAEQLSELLEAADWIATMAGPTAMEESSAIGLGQPSLPPGFHSPGPQDFPKAPSPTSDETLPVRPKVSGGDQRGIGSLDLTLPAGRGVGGADENEFSVEMSTGPGATQHTLPCRFGEYILERILGRGGMGVVYRAQQVQLERTVAIKMIRSGALASSDEVQRFYTEARSAAKLLHPNIVSVYQCGECEGHHYFSMDYIEGMDLSRLMQNGPMPLQQAARYVRDVASAIQYAHDRGVLHRDLKPANVLIDSNDAVHVTDFGLAKQMGTETGLTATGAALGTPSYMAPEQAGGRSEDHGPGTDVYSLGAILFALLAGKPPFQGESVVQTIMQVLHRPAPTLKSVNVPAPVDLETVVAKCLQKQPSRRYETAKDLADDLDRFLKHEPIVARPLGRVEKTSRWLLGIPLVGALVGNRMLEPTPAHRWAQRGFITAVVLLIASFFIVQYAQNAMRSRLPSHIRIAAGAPTGAYYEVATEIAAGLSNIAKYPPDIETTEGSAQNAKMLLDREADIGLVQHDSVHSAQLSVVAPLYYEALHILVRKKLPTEVSTVRDLRGLRVWTGPVKSGARTAARMVLRHAALTEADFTEIEIPWTDVLKEPQQIDAALIVIRAGQKSVWDLLASKQFKLIGLNDAVAMALDEPAFYPIQIAASDYPDGDLPAAGVSTLATTAFVAARKDAPDRLVNAVLQVLYDPEHPLNGVMSAEKATHWRGIPWHPAAERFFREQSAAAPSGLY